MSPLTLAEYEKLPPKEKEHFAKCEKCGEIFDRRSLDEVLFHHTDHKHRPDISIPVRKRWISTLPPTTAF
jgi:hypothetical protein